MELLVNAARLCKAVGWDYGERIEEACLEGASFGARARYRRARGLMLWQEGELEEADRHLAGAAMGFCRAGENGEESATMTLLNVGTPLQDRWAALERALFMDLRAAAGPGLEPLPFV